MSQFILSFKVMRPKKIAPVLFLDMVDQFVA